MDIIIDVREDNDFRVEKFNYSSDSITFELKSNFDTIILDMTHDQVRSLIQKFKSVGLIK